MEWGKAGRPRKKPVDEKPEDKDKWTKEELTLYQHGLYALACAVVNQWVKDGKPKSSEAGLLPWLSIIEQHDKENNNGC